MRKLLNNLADIISVIINYLLPPKCPNCFALTMVSADLCGNCWKKLNFIVKPYCDICGIKFDFTMEDFTTEVKKMYCGKCLSNRPEYDLGRSIFKFDQDSKKLIYGFKYNDRTVYASLFARLLFNRYRLELEAVDMIVPVPMYRFKRLYRKYNPPQLLAQELAKLISRPCIVDLLIKTRWTKSQTNLTKSQRIKNLTNSIEFNKKYSIHAKIILLIDDVHTTGTTGNTCSAILKKYGAKEVRLMTIAIV